jgi:hypothetical protein
MQKFRDGVNSAFREGRGPVEMQEWQINAKTCNKTRRGEPANQVIAADRSGGGTSHPAGCHYLFTPKASPKASLCFASKNLLRALLLASLLTRFKYQFVVKPEGHYTQVSAVFWRTLEKN